MATAFAVFLAGLGPEFDPAFDPAFVEFHVGTGDLNELLELTWERNDLSPLVDAGLKPLFRNKLYRAILEENTRREKCNLQLSASTATPSSASALETDSETELIPSELTTGPTTSESKPSSAITLSISEPQVALAVLANELVTQAETAAPANNPVTQAESITHVINGAQETAAPTKDPVTIQQQAEVKDTLVRPEVQFKGNCNICGKHGHSGSNCTAAVALPVTVFPLLPTVWWWFSVSPQSWCWVPVSPIHSTCFFEVRPL